MSNVYRAACWPICAAGVGQARNTSVGIRVARLPLRRR